MHPILLELMGLPVPSYGLFVASGVVAGLLTLKRRADGAGLDGGRLVDVALWLVVWALIGAKGLLILVEFPRYIQNPGELLGVLRAGGVFLGAFLTALVAGAWLFHRHRLPPLPTLDALVPSVALGQAIGRLGCLLAGCCWGSHCDLPWAITYADPQAAANVGTPLHISLHPFPVYAAAFNFLLYLGLAALHSKRLATGRVFATYLAVYGCGRFLLENFRGDLSRGFLFDGALSTSQLISSILVVFGVVLHLWISKRGDR
jgi:phosphatidylglycerol:prolipoprotein diacylglycerol transferase